MPALVLVCACLVVPSLARAGGDFVDLAVAGSRVWFVGAPGVRELDARTGHTIASPRPTGAAYPLSVTVAGGAAWVASVENGYVSGTLTRIDTRTATPRVLWHNAPVQYVAAGAGSVWALIGSARVIRIARFSLAGRLTRVWPLPAAGRIAADGSGCWISTNRWLLHIDPEGRLHRVTQATLGDLSTGGGAVWLPQATTVLRIDEHSGRIRTLHTGPLQLGGFQHDLAYGADALWALARHGRDSSLERLDPKTGRRTATLKLTGIANALVVRPNAVWIAAVIVPPNKPATGYTVTRINPHTLRRDLTVHLT